MAAAAAVQGRRRGRAVSAPSLESAERPAEWRLEALRELMKIHQLDAYFVTISAPGRSLGSWSTPGVGRNMASVPPGTAWRAAAASTAVWSEIPRGTIGQRQLPTGQLFADGPPSFAAKALGQPSPLSLAAAATATATSVRRRSGRSQPSRPRPSPGQEEVFLWGGVPVTGEAVKWLRSQQAMSGTFEPSPIQDIAMERIYSGERCPQFRTFAYHKRVFPFSGKMCREYGCHSITVIKVVLHSSSNRNWQNFMFFAANAAAIEGGGECVAGQRAALPDFGANSRTSAHCCLSNSGQLSKALARALLGRGLAENVYVMRRNASNTSIPSNIVVATPRQIKELLETPLTQAAWRRSMGALEMVVVDEADRLVNKWNMHQRRQRYKAQKELGSVTVLKVIEYETTKAGRRDDWQLVAASATMGRRSHRNLKFSAGIDLTLIRVPGSIHWQAPEKPNLGQYRDGTTNWPEGLRHRVRVPKPFRFPKVMAVTAQTIFELAAKRVLVVLATTPEGGRTPKSMYGLNLVLGELNFRLEEFGRFEVVTCNEAIDDAAKLWSAEGAEQRRQQVEEDRCQVIIASCEAIRGIHLDNIDAVVLVGDPMSVGDYQHCAGRTCRYQRLDRMNAPRSRTEEDVSKFEDLFAEDQDWWNEPDESEEDEDEDALWAEDLQRQRDPREGSREPPTAWS
eukprot:g17497.t1